jgi:hypothetical protein
MNQCFVFDRVDGMSASRIDKLYRAPEVIAGYLRAPNRFGFRVFHACLNNRALIASGPHLTLVLQQRTVAAKDCR